MGTALKRTRGPRLRDIVICIVLLVVLVLLALPIIRNTMHAKLARTCQDNLNEWAAIFAMYSGEHYHYFPPAHGYEPFGEARNAPGCRNVDDAFDFAPDWNVIHPDYAKDPIILACPDAGHTLSAMAVGPVVIRPPRLDPHAFGVVEGPCDEAGTITRSGNDYTYFGLEMKFADDTDPQISEAQARELGLPAAGPANVVALLKHFQVDADTTVEMAQGRRGVAFNRGDYMSALGWPYAPYSDEINRALLGLLNNLATSTDSATVGLKLGVDFSEVAAQYASMPVMWDTIHQDSDGSPVFNHRGPDGCNVLYMDGHVEFKPYPGAFPVSKTFATMKAVH